MRKPLPGITFQASPPPLRDRLPRMDVAALVGFASAGPLDTPVAVEDEVRFRAIFGDDLALAWDDQAGAPHRAWLGPAVRAFFRNGGRRCWVVRVAGATAAANRFAVPGMVRVTTEGEFRPARLLARSEGAWSDPLRAGATLLSAPLGEIQVLEELFGLEIDRTVRESLRPGDLLRVLFRERDLLLFLTVEKAEELSRTWRVWGREQWFVTTSPVPLPAVPIIVRELRPAPEPPRLLEADWPEPSTLIMDPTDAPEAGALLELELEDGAKALLTVASRHQLNEPTSPPSERIALTAAEPPLWPLSIATGRELAGGRATAERLSFELWAAGGEGQMARLTQMGFAPPHPRFLGYLPTDTALYGPTDPDDPGQALAQLAAEPRFPLAALGPADIYLPIGLPLLPERERFAGPDPTTDRAEVRNGLAAFDAEALFLDPDLASLTAEALPSAIFQKRDVQGRPLKGIHAIWPLEEVTLLAVPDAVHPPWEEADPPHVELLLAPELYLDGESPRWSEVDYADDYQLEESTETDACQTTRFYRVRALRKGQPGPWSNTVRLLPPETFLNCADDYLEPPWLGEVTLTESATYDLTWTAAAGALRYTLQESASADFSDPADIYQGALTAASVLTTGERPAYFRVRAEDGARVSPWSNTVLLFDHRALPRWRLTPPALAESLLPIHRAILRLARARADLLAILTLPEQDREREAVAYTRLLTGALQAEDDRALSYGALYHPWLHASGGEASHRLIPPDGSILGQIASRAIDRGAWIAPANTPLTAVLALAPTLGPQARELFINEQINQIRREPRGFLTLSAETLSPDPDLQPIGVRRLLILLRRLALREGQNLVFQPNDHLFRSRVQRQFEGLLTDMFSRGAFAGATPDESFQVVTGPAVNTPQSIDQGRFIVELRVAPSQPLVFLRVRLVQAHGEAAVTEV